MTEARRDLLFAVAALILCGLVAAALIEERDARQKAESTAAMQQQIINQKNDSIRERDAADAKYSAALARQAVQVTTPQQAAQVILRYLPAPAAVPAVPGQPAAVVAPAPIVTVERSQLTAAEQKALPVAPSYGILTGDQLQAVARQEIACDATSHTLEACSADRTDLKASLDARTKESAAWEAAAKGGTRWQRVGRALKLIGCSAAGAGVGSLASKQAPALGAAVGAGAGVTVCSLF